MQQRSSNNLGLNSILISPRVAAWAYCSSFDIYWFPEQFFDYILSQSARKIYVPFWDAEQIEFDLNKISKIAGQHIEIIDKNKTVFSKTKNIVQQIEDGISFKKHGEELTVYQLNRIFEALYHMQLSVQYEVDCDISNLNQLRKDVIELSFRAKDKEVRSFLNEFVGIINLYKSTKVCRNVFSTRNCDNISDRIKELILDCTFLETSEARRKITLTGNEGIISEIQRLTKRLSMKKSYKNFIKLIKLPLSFVPEDKKETGQRIFRSLFEKSEFTPSLIDIEASATNMINRLSIGPHDISTGKSEVIPWSAYQISRDAVYRQRKEIE